MGSGIVALAVLETMAVRVVAGNSDGATAVLEGRSIASGHVLLQGWRLSLDSFWTIDALADAAGVAIGGIRPELLRAVPVAIASAVVAVSVALATRGLHGRSAALAGVSAFALLALPGRALGTFFLQGPYHVGTTLYCLAAFAAFASGRVGGRWVAGVCLLAAAMLGDYQAIPLGIVPVIVTGILDARRERNLRAATPLVVGGVASIVLAIGVRALARLAGGFAPTRANPLASHGQMLRNLVHLPNEALALIGLTTGPFGSTGVPLALTIAHVLAVGLIVFGAVHAWRRIFLDVVAPAGSRQRGTRRFEDLVAFALLGDLATFVLLPITNSYAYGRYLTAGVVFSVILAARRIGTASDRGVGARAPVLVVAALSSVAVASFALALRGAGPEQPAARLAAFLSTHHLDRGVGDYWSSSIVTVESHGTVAVRPVVSDAGRLVRYEKQSNSSWYAGVNFDFYVYDTALIWNGDDRGVAIATFGRPVRTYPVGTYRVLIWPVPFHVGVVGSQGP
ncbi:MAG TPA: hypothetical protein VG368_03220 [Acidimicrobiales bacterium]|nr:hypothetical protein [Acidimicrobiales bacterium]